MLFRSSRATRTYRSGAHGTSEASGTSSELLNACFDARADKHRLALMARCGRPLGRGPAALRRDAGLTRRDPVLPFLRCWVPKADLWRGALNNARCQPSIFADSSSEIEKNLSQLRRMRNVWQMRCRQFLIPPSRGLLGHRRMAIKNVLTWLELLASDEHMADIGSFRINASYGIRKMPERRRPESRQHPVHIIVGRHAPHFAHDPLPWYRCESG